MKGNDKIAFTAEAVAFMRANEKEDEYSKYFVSDSIIRKYKFIGKIIPKNILNRIFHRRINLTRDLDKFIRLYKPQQIVELACGYSVRGLKLTRSNKKLVYIETDFQRVIEKKKNILNKISKEKRIDLSRNYHLIEIDAIKDDLRENIIKYIDKRKKTLIIAETLTSYLNSEEHKFLIENINKLLNGFDNAAYLSHEGRNKMLSGFFGKLLLTYRNIISKTRSHKHFNNIKDLKNFFTKYGFNRFKTFNSESSGNLIYLAIK